MDKRTLVALLLMAIVIVVTPMIFPSGRARQTTTARDSARLADSLASHAAAAVPPTVSSVTPPTVSAPTPLPAATTTAAPRALAPAETVSVESGRARFRFLSRGAAPLGVELPGYQSLRPGRRDTMRVESTQGALLHYGLVSGKDTIALDTIPFAVQRTANAITFTAASPPLSITYDLTPEGFLARVRGTLAGAPADAQLLVNLPGDLRSAEADTVDDMRHLAYGYKIGTRNIESIPFGKLDTNVVRSDTGAMTWIATRNKYWLVALLRPAEQKTGAAFTELVMRGQRPTVAKVANRAAAVAVQPVNGGRFGFDLYIGPQSWADLHALGNEIENVNPYAGWLHGVVQPFATIVMRILLWMKHTLSLSYGWILVIFGVTVRMLLWPLNQKAMRTSLDMQRLQPQLAEIQKRYKTDMEKQREAMMKLYAEHGMSPFSPMLGCLPMLLPMPVLFALYFVFQNTIEFRGVSFLWLPDISLRDPLFITPLAMGVSMFILSWIGMRAAPPNPQTKMMSYMMPVMFTFMFLNFASGLNLYYAVQNIAALPQQWLLSRERQRAGGGTVQASGVKSAARR